MRYIINRIDKIFTSTALAVLLLITLLTTVDTACRYNGIDSAGIYSRDVETGSINLLCHKGLPRQFIEKSSFYSSQSPQAKLVAKGNIIFSRHKEIGIPLDKEKLAEGLKEFIENPNVNVTVLRASSNTISVVGNVSQPGLYTVGSPKTVLDVLALAGGVTEWAKTKNIKILRQEYGRTLQFRFNYKDVLKGKKLDQNITLKSGDIVMIP